VVAGAQAADAFGLQLLAPAIHDDPNNYTRFLVLERARESRPVARPDKASLYFYTSHAPGCLAQVLTLIAAHGLNLSKLQSCPRPSQPWHYGFHADVEFDEIAQLDALLADLEAVTEELRVLGAYRRGSMAEALGDTPLLAREGMPAQSAGWGGWGVERNPERL